MLALHAALPICEVACGLHRTTYEVGLGELLVAAVALVAEAVSAGRRIGGVGLEGVVERLLLREEGVGEAVDGDAHRSGHQQQGDEQSRDRKSTRLNSSH